jgi:hypothetical protein
MKHYITIIISVIIAFICKIEGIWAFIILLKESKIMQITNWQIILKGVDAFGIPILIVGIIWYFLFELNRYKKTNNAIIEEMITTMEHLLIINQRKEEYFHECIKQGKYIKPPKSWVTDYEKKLRSQISNEKINKLFQDSDKSIDE